MQFCHRNAFICITPIIKEQNIAFWCFLSTFSSIFFEGWKDKIEKKNFLVFKGTVSVMS